LNAAPSNRHARAFKGKNLCCGLTNAGSRPGKKRYFAR
jgi:hypothetical protein